MLYLVLLLRFIFFPMQLISPHRISTFITCWQHVWQIAFCCSSWGWAICFISREPCIIRNDIFLFHSLGNSTCMLISYLTPKYIIPFGQVVPPFHGPGSTMLWMLQCLLHLWERRPRGFLLDHGQVAVTCQVRIGGINWRYLRSNEEKKTSVPLCFCTLYGNRSLQALWLISAIASHLIVQ